MIVGPNGSSSWDQVTAPAHVVTARSLTNQEVRTPNADRLPIIPDRVEIAELFATEDALERLAFRTLYKTGLRETEFLALNKGQLAEGFLNVAGRRVVLGPETLKELNELDPSLFWMGRGGTTQAFERSGAKSRPDQSP